MEIKPQLGTLSTVQGTATHPLGDISVSFSRNDRGVLNALMQLPEGLSGDFIYKQKTYPLGGGENKFNIE